MSSGRMPEANVAEQLMLRSNECPLDECRWRMSSTILYKVICNYRNEQERSLRSVGEGDSGARG